MADEHHFPHVIPDEPDDQASLDSLDPVHALNEVLHTESGSETEPAPDDPPEG